MATRALNVEHSNRNVEKIYHDWDEALSQNDAEALLALYAKDAVIESPLIPHLMKKPEGVCRGHDEMRPFFELVTKRKPVLRHYFRAGYFTDGKRIIWEYPRLTPDGEQMDFVESMELNDQGLIQYHKVYWGWRGCKVLQEDAYHH